MDQDQYEDRQPQRRRSSQRPQSGRPSQGNGQRRRSSRPAQGQGQRRPQSGSGHNRPSAQGGRRPSDGRRPSGNAHHNGHARRRPDSTGSHRPTSRKAVAADARRNANRDRMEAPRKPSNGLPFSPLQIGLGVLGVVVVGVGIFFLVGVLSRFDVTVNGEKVTLGPGSTVKTLLEKKVVSPKPGNLLAIDGSMLTEGGGDPCSATVDGNKATVDTELKANNVVEIGDGEDTTESAKTTEEKIPFKQDEGDRTFEAYWFGSIHLLSDGEDGIETTSTGDVSGKTITEVTKEPINAGYRIYTAKPDDKVIALTFDDGPWPDTTDDILNILEENNAKATFFTIGNQIASNEAAVKRAHDMGCQVLTHTWDHAEGSGGGTSIANMSSSEQVDEVKKGYAAIADVLGEEPAHILRAPGGNFFGETITNLWDLVDAEIGWDVDTEDWRRPGSDSIANMILSAKSGQVVLMHDGGGDRSQTVEALRQTLSQLVEQGYKFITIDELLAYGMPSSKSSIPSTADDEESSTSGSSGSSTTSESTSESSGMGGGSTSESSGMGSESTSDSTSTESSTSSNAYSFGDGGESSSDSGTGTGSGSGSSTGSGSGSGSSSGSSTTGGSESSGY